jgi:hypothetical protein
MFIIENADVSRDSLGDDDDDNSHGCSFGIVDNGDDIVR